MPMHYARNHTHEDLAILLDFRIYQRTMEDSRNDCRMVHVNQQLALAGKVPLTRVISGAVRAYHGTKHATRTSPAPAVY